MIKDFDSFFNDTGENIFNTLENDYQKAEYLQNLLAERATGGDDYSEDHYQKLRGYFIKSEVLQNLIPRWIRSCRNLPQFWQFIKKNYSTYEERRIFIWQEFQPLFDYLESSTSVPHESKLLSELNEYDSSYLKDLWKKALIRSSDDPDGTITIARTMIEGVLKHVLDDLKIDYGKNPDIHELYKLVAKELRLNPEQHEEPIFKQILGGCSSIVSGMGQLRNAMGDAHGQGRKSYKPSARHAELTLNISGSICLFILETYNKSHND